MSQTIRHGAGEFSPDQRWNAGGKYLLHFTARGNLELWNTGAQRLLWQSETTDAVKLAMCTNNIRQRTGFYPLILQPASDIVEFYGG